MYPNPCELKGCGAVFPSGSQIFNWKAGRVCVSSQTGWYEQRKAEEAPRVCIKTRRLWLRWGDNELWVSIRLYSWSGCLTPLAWLCLAAGHTETESERRKNLCRNVTKREGSIKFALKNNKWGRKVKCFLSTRKTCYFIKGDVTQIKYAVKMLQSCLWTFNEALINRTSSCSPWTWRLSLFIMFGSMCSFIK